MQFRLLFCTSPRVTSELQPSASEPDDHVAVFEHATNEQLRTLLSERQGERCPWIESGIFLVLDERSTVDKTVVVQMRTADFNDNEGFDDESHEIDHEVKVMGHHWEVWRVYFAECWTWLFEMKCNVEVGEELFLKEKAKFTDTTGLFGVKSALAWWYSEPSSNREGGPKLA